MSGTAKVAALLLAMNKQLAARVLKHFDEEQVKVVAQAANDLGKVPKETVDTIIEEFAYDIKNGADLTATNEKIQGLLEGVLSPDQIAALMAQTGTKSAHAVWQHLRKIPEMAMTQYLMKEHPQIIALVLSRAEATTSASLLKMLPRALSKDVVGRMLSLRPVRERPLVLLEISFLQDLLLNRRRDSDVPTHTRLAEVINKMDRKLMEECLQAVATYNEKDAELIRQQLFTFEDLIKLPKPSLVTVFDSIVPDLVIKALYGVPKPFQEHLLEAVPSRARRAIVVELTEGPPVRTRETLKAQRTIADIALELIERGVIETASEEEAEEI
ncbi:FliG C-terminal domain-containing protein [Hyphomicrobium sp. LHD-15]|uniref:flagellar motor switch protein FliG n=1 Tax=Hyphomicrobium sp. LHD-15 TaxID=3072142 RepID=UPI0028109288|nr:FliG C-terminal domain-containing protein [Hyphomicrobium sp. LHD-15]MDQ8700169.1 FliG C-terminal domain-containing protein [Hyphomicrobium sp. LHD-15]